MSLADDLKPLLYNIRAIPGQLGLRPYSLSVIIVFHSGTYAGDGNEGTDSIAITEANGQPPKIRALNDEELALAGLSRETYEVGPITPECSAGGTPLSALLAKDAESGDQVQYILTGPKYPNGVRCERVAVIDYRALHYKIRIQPISARE